MEIQHCMGMFLIQCGNLIRLDWKDLLETGLGHHLFPRSVAKKLGIEEWAKLTAYSWYPYETAGSGALHQKLHRLLIEQGVPFHGSIEENKRITGSTKSTKSFCKSKLL